MAGTGVMRMPLAAAFIFYVRRFISEFLSTKIVRIIYPCAIMALFLARPGLDQANVGQRVGLQVPLDRLVESGAHEAVQQDSRPQQEGALVGVRVGEEPDEGRHHHEAQRGSQHREGVGGHPPSAEVHLAQDEALRIHNAAAQA